MDVQTDFGFSFDAAPTRDTVLDFGSIGDVGDRQREIEIGREDEEDLEALIQVEQVGSIFELQI